MTKLKTAALAATALCAFSIAPAYATLRLSIGANGSTFTCFDGQLSCDQSGGANNLLTIDTTVGGAFVQLTLTTSSFGNPDTLSLSSSNIINESGAPIAITLLASDTNFVAPIAAIRESSSLTFNDAVGSPASFEKFWADTTNTQGANPSNTPGTLLFTATGTPIQNPDSFDGTHLSTFAASAPFSLTEGTTLNLIAGGSVTGLNQQVETSIPEPRTWALLALGFVAMALVGYKRKRAPRFAI